MRTLSDDDVNAMQHLADDDVDWASAREVTYLLHQRFRYEYPGPIADLHHRLVVVPRERHGDQRRVAHRIDVSPEAAEYVDRDAFGNPVVTFFARRIDRAIEFSHWSVVTRVRDGAHVDADALRAPEWRMPTALTAADAALRERARVLRAEHADARALASAIVAFTHGALVYTAGATTVETTAAEAFAHGRGVCQDFAHVALALARRCGLAARYVSGHLMGEGGTHAWIEFVLPDGDDATVIAYDPTHGCRVSMKYVVVSVGRDYADVAPTSGVFTAPYSGELTAWKRVGAMHVTYAEPQPT